MIFNSPEFLFFLSIVFVLHWIVLRDHRRLQNLMLLIFSCGFYMSFIPKYILILFITILIDYFAGIKIATCEGKKKKVYLVVSIVSTCLVLFVFKYFNFFVSNVNAVNQFFGIDYSIRTLNIILPIGLSFHTFQSLSYVIEVYRKKQKPEKDFLTYSLYVMYFPQLVAGPIERAGNLLHQFHEKKKFDFALAVEGMHQILWGLFKKVVIADTCALYANHAFHDYDHLSGVSLFIGASAFAFQIYGDFSGYSDIALGTSKLFGIRLMRNFNLPYFATNISEFWRRWHISLSTWFRDYVYIPLGGSRVKGYKFYRNIFVIFVLSGIWHGANWTFVVWGLIHALVYTFYFILFGSTQQKRKEKKVFQGAKHSTKWMARIQNFTGGILTFFVVTLAWIFFRATDIQQAFSYLTAAIKHAFIGNDVMHYLPVTLIILPFVVFEWINRNSHNGVLLSAYGIRPVYRMILELIISLMIIDCYYTLDHSQFIYFQF